LPALDAKHKAIDETLASGRHISDLMPRMASDGGCKRRTRRIEFGGVWESVLLLLGVFGAAW